MRIVFLCLILSACGEPARDIPYSGRRSAPPLKEPVRAMSASERFGAGPVASKDKSSDSPLVWSVPSGWEELEPTQMRMVNFKVGEEGECYLTILGGDGGGVLGNVNRWREQLGLSEIGESDVAALSTLKVLGRDAYLLDLQGTYTGMGLDPREGWALRGAITTSSQFTLFVKFIGPQALVEREGGAFESFCSSLAFSAAIAASSPGAAAHGAPAAGPAPAPGKGPVVGAKPGSGAGSAPGGGGGFSWDVPAGWTPELGGGMRLVTFRTGAVECYVVILGGTGGGVVGNIQRWVGQLGLEVPSEAEVAAMPLVEVLGVQAPLLEATGDYTGMGDAEATPGVMMLGLPVLISGRAVFLKMLGPEKEVAAQRDSFLAFAASLTLDGDVK